MLVLNIILMRVRLSFLSLMCVLGRKRRRFHHITEICGWAGFSESAANRKPILLGWAGFVSAAANRKWSLSGGRDSVVTGANRKPGCSCQTELIDESKPSSRIWSTCCRAGAESVIWPDRTAEFWSVCAAPSLKSAGPPPEPDRTSACCSYRTSGETFLWFMLIFGCRCRF